MTALRIAQLEKKNLAHRFFCSSVGTKMSSKRTPPPPPHPQPGFAISYVIKPPGVTVNHWFSSDVACSHKWCHIETCAFYVHVSPCHVTNLTSNNAICFGTILMPLFTLYSGDILENTDEYLKV